MYVAPPESLLRKLKLPPTAPRTLHDRYRMCTCTSVVHGEEYVRKVFFSMNTDAENILWDHLMETNHV